MEFAALTELFSAGAHKRSRVCVLNESAHNKKAARRDKAPVRKHKHTSCVDSGWLGLWFLAQSGRQALLGAFTY